MSEIHHGHGSYDPDNDSRQYRIPIQDPCAPPSPQPIQSFPPPQRKWLCSCCFRRKEPNYDGAKYAGTGAGADEESGQQESQPTYLGRKWKHFPGHNKFYCGGRVMTAPNIHYCFFSFTLIVVTFGLFITFDGPFLMNRLSIAIPITSSCLFIIVIINMLRTTCSDPGILPRASRAEVEHLERSYGNSASTYRPPPRTKEIMVNGQVVKSKYCFTCKMFRPPRASHCSICDNCVERFDHHCPFLGNCIGRRNYRSFYFFVISVSCLAVMILAGAIAHLALLSKDLGNFVEALRESPTSAVCGLISFFGMWTVIGLAGFHSYLIAVEQTTNEDIKGIFGRPDAKNPYSRGSVCQNCCFVLCGPSPPSLIDARGYVTSEFLEALPKSKDFAPAAGAGGANNNPHSNTPLPVGSFGGHECMEAPKHSSGMEGHSNGPILTQEQIRFLGTRNHPLEQVPGSRQIPNGPGAGGFIPNGSVASSSNYGYPNPPSVKSGTFPEAKVQANINSHSPPDQIDRIYSASSISTTGSSSTAPAAAANNDIQLNVIKNSSSTSRSPSSGKLLHESQSISPSSIGIPGSSTSNKTNNSNRSNSNSKNKKVMLDQMTMINSPLHLDTVM